VYANIGKLLLATKIYDMQRIAHYVSGGLIVTLPGPDEDHNPETKAALSAVLAGRPDIPAEQRLEVARFIEDLTASYQSGWYSVISLHGGGSPEAMKREIWRNYPLEEKTGLVERLLDRGLLTAPRSAAAQPGRCCTTGCQVPEGTGAAATAPSEADAKEQPMDEAAFRQDLMQRGCSESYLVEWAALRRNQEHSHPFTARGLVLEGDFEIATPGWTRRFGPGEIFEVAAGTPHMETVGAQGIRLISGKLEVA
jgi:hypothetical protein